LPDLVIYSAHGSKVSNLTGSTLNEAEGITANTSKSSSNSAKSGSISDSTSASIESISEVILDSGSKQMDLCLGGRPKGSTVPAAVDLKKRIELTTHDAVVLLSEAVSKRKKNI
jgi:hypothetical protein